MSVYRKSDLIEPYLPGVGGQPVVPIRKARRFGVVGMDVDEYERYGRQMIVPGVGSRGQLALREHRVLVIGAGGLGCPALAYLAGAGVGTLGIVDPDRVEVSNLHRQILHHRVGQPKAESAAEYVTRLNPKIVCQVYVEPFTSLNGLALVRDFDLVLDCTDTPMSRYLINDACVLADKPLVSASALKTEGQLAVYHFGKTGPCYRCVFPKPPPPQLVGTCGDNGILGPVVGLMGVAQAVEALKVLLTLDEVRAGDTTPQPFLSIYSMFSFPQWRQMKIRFRQPGCAVCGDEPSITSLDADYEGFCGSASTVSTTHRLQPHDFAQRSEKIVDVRPASQYAVVVLPESVSVPITQLRRMDAAEFRQTAGDSVRMVCHHGTDSQEAVEIVRAWGVDACDLAGGLTAWAGYDPSFPVY